MNDLIKKLDKQEVNSGLKCVLHGQYLYIALVPHLLKAKENIKKSGDFRYIYQSKLDKAFYST